MLLAVPIFGCCAAATAQLREPCFVTVRDEAGTPLVATEVTLVGRRLSLNEGPEVIRAVTDARGRCQPELLPARHYTAWAASDARQDGSRLASEPEPRVFCGRVIELECQAVEPTAAGRFVTDVGAEPPWARGVYLFDPLLGTVVPLAAGGDDSFHLPTRCGRPQWIAVGSTAAAAVPIREVPPNWRGGALRLPPMRPTRFRVITPLRQPLDRVVVELDPFGNRCLPLGSTDANGEVTLDLPLGEQALSSGSLRIVAAGRATKHLRISDLAPAEPVQEFVLQESRPNLARLRGLLPEESAVVQVGTWSRTGRGSRHQRSEVPVRADVVELTSELEALEHAFAVVLFPERASSPPRIAMFGKNPGPVRELPDLDLTRLQRFPIRIVDRDGGPAAGAAIVVLDPPPATTMYPVSFARSLASTNGRAEVLLQGGPWAIYVHNGIDHGLVVIGDGEPAQELSLRLSPIPCLDCRVVDAGGRPIRGAAFDGFGQLGSRQGWAWNTLSTVLAGELAARARSDRDGRLSIPLLDLMGEPRQLHVRPPGSPSGSRYSTLIHLTPGTIPTVTLR